MIARIPMIVCMAAVLFFSAGLPSCPATLTAPAQQKDEATFVCPMHPEVKSASPGSCPKCGMKLTHAAIEAQQDESSSAEVKPGGSALNVRIPEVSVYDQDGKRLDFYADLIKGKTVAINFIFTTCTTICPPLTATMRQVQRQMGERVGRDVWLVSVSVDPVTDTPERLKSFAAKFGAGPGWSFVTGGKAEIDRLLKALGAYVSDKNNHSPIILIGNEPSRYWLRSYGLAPASTIARLVAAAADHPARQ